MTDADRARLRRRHRWRQADTGPLVFLFLVLCAALLGGYAACTGWAAVASAYGTAPLPPVCDQPMVEAGWVPELPRCGETFGPFQCYLANGHEGPHHVDLSRPNGDPR